MFRIIYKVGQLTINGERFFTFILFRRLWVHISRDRHSFRIEYIPL